MGSAPAPQGAATQLSANGLISITWVGVALGIAFTAARVAIHLRKMKRLLVDDRFVLFALGLLILNATLQTIQAPRPYYMALTPTAEDIKYHTLRYVHLEFVIIGLFWSVLWSIKGAFGSVLEDSRWTSEKSSCMLWDCHFCIPCVYWVLAGVGIYMCPSIKLFQTWYLFLFMLDVLYRLINLLNFPGQCSKPIDIKGSVIPICYSTTVDIVTDLMSTTIAPEDKWLRNNNYLVMCLPLRILWEAKIQQTPKRRLGNCILRWVHHHSNSNHTRNRNSRKGLFRPNRSCYMVYY
jgi:hypothetical protein